MKKKYVKDLDDWSTDVESENVSNWENLKFNNLMEKPTVPASQCLRNTGEVIEKAIIVQSLDMYLKYAK